jgi:molybdopterin molybdotransferase
VEKGVSVERAVELACNSVMNLKIETVVLSKSYGRTLAESLNSKVDDPRFDNSAMDGWAVCSSDFLSEITILKIVGTSKAGKSQPLKIRAGQACQIMTGAPMPVGADAIVVVENSQVKEDTVTLTGPPNKNYIRKKSENLSLGEEALFAGMRMTAASISLAATMGFAEIKVVKKPKIAIISTGDELVSPGDELSPGEIYESNSFGIAALIEKMGGTAIRFNPVTDTIDSLRSALNTAASECDAILTSGGVSMGEWDFVRKLMEEEGDMKFWRVQMRPGGPPLFGEWNEVPIFGLPGNPVSSHVVFLMIVAPWISFNLGSGVQAQALGKYVRVKLQDPIFGAKNKICLRRINITSINNELIATTHTHQGSGNIHSLVAHNALSILPPSVDAEAGKNIDAFWWNE